MTWKLNMLGLKRITVDENVVKNLRVERHKDDLVLTWQTTLQENLTK